jgi:predicted nucleotidyltransferase
MKKRDKILQEAKARLVAAFGDKIKDVILFGSRAWGKPHRWSDWDMVVIVRGENNWGITKQIRYVLYDMELEFDVLTQALVISEHELRHTLRGAQPIFQKALAEGIYA